MRPGEVAFSNEIMEYVESFHDDYHEGDLEGLIARADVYRLHQHFDLALVGSEDWAIGDGEDEEVRSWIAERGPSLETFLSTMPPIVLARRRGGYEILDGCHRVRAVRILGGRTIPAYVPETSKERRARELSTGENERRWVEMMTRDRALTAELRKSIAATVKKEARDLADEREVVTGRSGDRHIFAMIVTMMRVGAESRVAAAMRRLGVPTGERDEVERAYFDSDAVIDLMLGPASEYIEAVRAARLAYRARGQSAKKGGKRAGTAGGKKGR